MMTYNNPLTRAKKKQALEFFQLNRLDESKSLYTVVCKADRRDADAWNMLGAVHGMLGEYAEAEACCRQVIALQPDLAGTYNNLANALKFQGKLEEAKAAYLRAIKLQPRYAEAHNNLGSLLKEQGDLEGAEASCRLAISLQPDHAEAFNNLGALLRNQNKLEEAAGHFLQAVKLKPSYFDAVFNLGMTSRLLGKLDDALACFQRTVQLWPGDTDSLGQLGNTFERAGKLDEAVACFRRLLQVDPDHVEALISLGGLYYQQGKSSEAVSTFRQALQFKPDSAEANYFLAALGEGAAPDRSPEVYVRQLFDNYAERFDRHLVDGLQYRAPELLHEAVKRVGEEGLAGCEVIDLGCGTGLCGPLFRGLARHLTGVDLSPRMLDKARERNVYDRLIEGDVVSVLARSNQLYDLIISTDVFIYLGDLEPIFENCKSTLKPGGLFAFSTETAEEGVAFELRPSGRYAQSPGYIRGLAQAAGLKEISMDSIVLRQESQVPMPGNIFVFRKEL